MHLKTLTLRGFKSFASATTLRFEPGITCVVGPNGSGKSNVVDALAWVMGEQGARTLRGGTMEDVVFAGTTGPGGRAPLGRAEVSLTIDNADGALPVDYAEVTISRTMFRTGGSEYRLNGDACRLLDVQELLSDSGIGREMHVIVGQNQLDAVLRATPEDRRGFVEEAAGVLKHRRRKEKALRKLDAMQANLVRLTDLTAELRRQLAPLGRQAEVARRAQAVQADARDARARLLADDLAQLTATLEAEVADETALRERRAEVEEALAAARRRLADLEREADEAAPRLAALADTAYRVASVRDGLTGLAALAEERVRLLGATDDPTAGTSNGRDPDDLEAQAARARRDEADLTGEAERARERLQAAVAERSAAEDALHAEERRVAALARAAADRREGLARLAGQVAARRSRVEAAEAEAGRLADALAEARHRAAAARDRVALLEEQVAGAEAGEEGLDTEHERAAAALADADADLERLREAARRAEHDRATWAARLEALRLGLDRGDGAAALLAAHDRVPGLLGSVAALLDVRPGCEQAVAAALGAAADAVVVESLDAAVGALRLLRDDDAGRAGLVVAGGSGGPDAAMDGGPGAAVAGGPGAAGDGGGTAPDGNPDLPAGAVPAASLVEAPPALGTAVATLLAGHVVVEGLAEARAVVAGRPDLVAVTRDGDVLAAHRAAGGSRSAPTLLQVQAAVDEADAALASADAEVRRSREALDAATAAREEAAASAERALARLHESDARLAAVAEQLGQHAGAARAAEAEAERLERARAAAQEGLAADRAALADLVARLRRAEESGTGGRGAEKPSSIQRSDVGRRDTGVDVPDDGTRQPAADDPDTAERDRLAAVASAARGAETEARLALRTVEERLRALGGRAEALEHAARTEREARGRAAARAERRRRQAQVAAAVRDGARAALDVVAGTLRAAGEHRDAAERDRAGRQEALVAVREQVDVLGRELAELTDSVHADEVARAQQRLRVEQLRERCVAELGMHPDVLVEEMGPHLPVPPSPPAPGDPEPAEPPQPRPYVREEQEKRLRAAERALTRLGKVNPLALEEFAALEERHAFLVEQLGDLERSRADLLGIVKDVDARVQEVFTAAYADVAKHFEEVFARLFPGGSGRLVLTEPDDMLATGIEVEARPAGKKVTRLSLLSGGERSLTAVAWLVAIFLARPSPFYVLDEVEAALDDTNLGRLLGLLEELRATSQLVVITHQKRTMEIADALYGVSMRADGVSAVVSQRLREEQPA